jgi:hypothetical protein
MAPYAGFVAMKQRKPDDKRSQDAVHQLAEAASDARRLRVEIERACERAREPRLRAPDPSRRVRGRST